MMMKLLGNRKKSVKESSRCDKGVQCNNVDPYVRLLILEKLPKYSNPSGENFNFYLQRLQFVMEALKIDEKDKVCFLFACLQGEASEKLDHSHPAINEKITWEEATTTLRKIFNPLQINNNIQTLRQAKQQPDQDFHDFTKTIQQLVKNIFKEELGYNDAHRENEVIRYMIRGAKKKLKDQLKGKKYNSVEEVIVKAQSLETTINSNN